MRNNKGYLLVEALLSICIISMILFLVMNILQTKNIQQRTFERLGDKWKEAWIEEFQRIEIPKSEDPS